MPRSIFPYQRSGVWETDYPLYVEEFIDLLEEYKDNVANLSKFMSNIPDTENEQDLYFFNYIDPQRNKTYMSYTKLILMACMSVEAFLNYYGVRRLGEGYFNENLERLSPLKKLRLIVAICFHEIYRDKTDELIEIADLYKRRNSLVHSSTKEYKLSVISDTPELFAPKEFTYDIGDEVKKALRSFFLLFKKYDSDVDLESNLWKLFCDT